MPVRIGLITPSSNTWVEPITTAMLNQLAPEVTTHYTRIRVTSIGLDRAELSQFDHKPMMAAARLLADSEVDLIAWIGTSGSWIGLDADRQLCRDIETATGIAATTSTLAITQALHGYGVRRYGLAVPYTREVAQRIVDTYHADGLECVNEKHLGISTNADFGRMTADGIAALVRSAAPGAEAVAVVCTNMAASPLVEQLESSIGIPIIDSIAATVWNCLDMIETAAKSVVGWGDLLLAGSLRVRLQRLMEDLLETTDASRTTVRLDIPERNLHVEKVAAESVRSGVKSIRHDGSLDQRAMPTVKWIGEQRRALVQNDFDTDGPKVSPELVAVYGVQAQMLGPLIERGRLVGWVSVHEVGRKRKWADTDIQALKSTCQKIEAILEPHPRSALGLGRSNA